ncbi:MAG: aromatic ring-hydroxylating dioxygenase subunit alpha [Actinomycetota bacterium]|uniref:Aromatic ring-hydroxylating dioxygenase subunit alpha n=1 Tax=Mycobacterium lentiflavum TaxID=141349 RepID=A0ABY3UST7_MYCLN|nr:aromatic ring-hydroxylating dioxygenase subunit alpha [Mycobacterium lentiflavum]MEE3062438.1 aromatic ring-hydroxylating dioxygenase subunit alpha [Actinomycetota bacterium]ULP40338.1 aromatic ring-hydroxylating dioxygenase subunit alpha [Mycobacterium lentiflavum]
MSANYPHDCWYVAASTEEVSREPLGRRLLDTPIMLYRLESGRAVALHDACGHRGYPLSRGHLDGDEITCAYHGIHYDASGACVRVPSQPRPPYGACVRQYPVREAGSFVWIWLGDPNRAQHRSLPELPWLTEPGWDISGTYLRVNANYMLVHEHYLDLTHIPWVHPQETPQDIDQVPALDEIQVSETSVTYTRGLPLAPLADWEATATGLPRDTAYRRRHHGTFVSPAVLAESWDIYDSDDKPLRHTRIQAVTPETETSTHLFWRFAHDYHLGNSDVRDHLHSVFEHVMRVDVDVLEAIEHNVGYRGSANGFRVSADAGVLKVRRIVTAMIDRENPALSAVNAVVGAL